MILVTQDMIINNIGFIQDNMTINDISNTRQHTYK